MEFTRIKRIFAKEGTRESRRFVGDYILNENDIENNHEIVNVYYDKQNDYSNTFSELGIKISNGIYIGSCKLFDFICYLLNYLFN